MFFYPWYPAMLLAFEATNVIDIRLRALALGGSGAKAEAELMVKEKIGAAFEAGTVLMSGGSPSSVIALYRRHVAANAVRLRPAR